MGIFGKSLAEKTQEAVAEIANMGLGVSKLSATLDGNVVTLRGEAESMEAKTNVMKEFNARVECDNVLNTIRVVAPAPQYVEVAAPERVHVVAPGDTLGALAKHYYGKAGVYMKIFDANKDILKDPNVIKVGQKLRIPE